MKRSACLPLLLTAVLLCSCGSNAKKAPTRPDHQRGAPVCRAQRRRHHRHLLHQFG